MHDELMKEIFQIVEKSLKPQVASSLVLGQAELVLKSPIVYVLNKMLDEMASDDLNIHFADVILTVSQRQQLEQFLKLINRIPIICIRQRSVDSFEDLVDLGCFKRLECLKLEHVNMKKLRWTSHLKSQLVSLHCRSCSEMDAVFTDKLTWSELVNLSLLHCTVEPIDNSCYFKNSPWLKTLNLSFCKLRTCEFLTNLNHLEHLNLSYNFIRKIPFLNVGNKLKTLKMHNNCVEDLSGIERIPTLRNLDLSNNWILSKYSFVPLKYLENLVSAKFENCPVSHIQFYRIYVASCIRTKVDTTHVLIDGVRLNKVERSVVGLNLFETQNVPPPAVNPIDHSTEPSTSAVGLVEPSTSAFSVPGTMKRVFKPSSVRVPIILDEDDLEGDKQPSSLSVSETEKSLLIEPSASLKGSIVPVSVTPSKQPRSEREAILSDPLPSQAVTALKENGVHNTVLRSDPSKLRLGSITISPLRNCIEDSPNWTPEIVPETVFALVHATESDPEEDGSSEKLGKPETPGVDTKSFGSSMMKPSLGYQLMFTSPNEISSIEAERNMRLLEEDLMADLNSHESQESLGAQLESDRENHQGIDMINATVVQQYNIEELCEVAGSQLKESLDSENISLKADVQNAMQQPDISGVRSDTTSPLALDLRASSELLVVDPPSELSNDMSGVGTSKQPSVDKETGDEEYDSSDSIVADETKSLAKEDVSEVKNEVEAIIAEDDGNISELKREEDSLEKSTGSLKDSDEESCYESDPDADEFLWHVMRVESTARTNTPIFLALLENELKERSPKSGETLTKWALDTVLSCVKTKNDPITIEMEFETVKRDKQHRVYVMEYADAQALTKKIYNILESRPLSAMNQVSHNCLKCATVFVYVRPSLFKKKENRPVCPVCGSTVVAETEEPKLPEKKVTSLKSLSHSPSQSSIGSAVSIEQSLKSEVHSNFRRYESDIEVISNPSQSSIEVIDESSRSQSVTPMRKKSEERQLSFTAEMSLRDNILSPLSALTESSSSGSLTESVITAYESHSMIVSKKSKSSECLPEESDNSSNNIVHNTTKGTLEEENGNLAVPKSVKDMYSFTDFVDVDLRVKTFIYHSVFKNENEELDALVRCHVWKTGGSDYDGCFVLSNSTAYFLYHQISDFSEQICDWLSVNESFRVADIKRIQPILWYQGLEIQIKNFSFILLLMDKDRTQSLIQHFSGLPLKRVKILPKPSTKVELSLQQAVLTGDLSHNSEDPTVTFMALCRSVEITKVEVSEEILRLAGLVITCGLFIIIPGDLSWLCSGSQPLIVTSRDLSSLIEVEKKGMHLVLHFLDEAEAVEEKWFLKLGTDTQLEPLLGAIRRPWERRFSVPLEVTGL